MITAIMALPAQAPAQEPNAKPGNESGVLDEVIVSARRREELLSDVPASITVFSAREIEKSNIEDVTDYLSVTPNVSFTESGIRSERDISIRGVSNIGGQVSAIAFYVDGFNIVNGPRTANTGNINSSINPALQDIERIEVLRGPQGTFFGRNSTGGAINITTKKPAQDFHAEASVEYGRFDTWAVGGVTNLPITDETVFLRVSAYREETDGAVRNVNPIGGGSGSDLTNMRVALRALPNDRLTIDLSANYTGENYGTAEVVATGLLSASSSGLLQALGHTQAISDGLAFYPQNRGEINHDFRDDLSNRFVTLVGRLEYVLEPVTITSITGYFDSEYVGGSDLDFTSFGYLEQRTEAQSDTFSQEVRLSATTPDRLEWVIGGLYAQDNLDQDFSVVPGPATFLGLPEGFRIDTGNLHYGTTSNAVFGELTWHTTERLDVTLGGRYSRDKIDQQAAGVTFEVPDVPGAGEISFSDFSPRIAATYEWTEGLTAYATVSRGYKAGGLQLNVTQQLPVFEFAEESLWNYEGGIRLEALDGRLRFDTSAFYMKWNDMQVSTNVATIDPDTNQITFINTTSNAASAVSKGVEVELQARPVPELRLRGTAGYLDATFDQFPNALVQGAITDLSDKPIPRAPEWTASAHADYSFTVHDNWESFVRAEWSYRSETFPTIDSLLQQGFPYRAPSFSVWNFRAGVDTGKFSVTAFIENAFDKQYFTKTDDFGFAGIRLHPAYRTYGVQLHVRFD